MNKRMLLLIFPFLYISSFAQADLPKDEQGFYQQLVTQINSRHLQWAKANAKGMMYKNPMADTVKARAEAYGKLNGLQQMDIEAMAFLVMMEAAKSSQQDIKSIMEGVKQINKSKELMRQGMEDLNNKNHSVTRPQLDSVKKLYVLLPAAFARLNMKFIKTRKSMAVDSAALLPASNTGAEISKEELDVAKEKIKNDLDTMNGLAESESRKLQVYMNRYNKMIETMSNMMKKFSDTRNSIISNLK